MPIMPSAKLRVTAQLSHVSLLQLPRRELVTRLSQRIVGCGHVRVAGLFGEAVSTTAARPKPEKTGHITLP